MVGRPYITSNVLIFFRRQLCMLQYVQLFFLGFSLFNICYLVHILYYSPLYVYPYRNNIINMQIIVVV